MTPDHSLGKSKSTRNIFGQRHNDHSYHLGQTSAYSTDHPVFSHVFIPFFSTVRTDSLLSANGLGPSNTTMKQADRANPALTWPAFQCRDGVAKREANKEQAFTDIIQCCRKDEAESGGQRKHGISF